MSAGSAPERSVVVTGRAWMFGDHMNTDLMLPISAYRVPVHERPMLVFSANRPGWAELVRPGDVIVAGENFGVGSGRPVSTVLQELGIAGIAADSVNGLFYRSAINAGLPIVACPGVTRMVTEGDRVTIDPVTGTVADITTGESLSVAPMHSELQEIVAAGGVIARLRRAGYLPPQASPAAATGGANRTARRPTA
ncbi:MAG: 3-isopropylmalate dehydratase [Herbiconiux sp.]|uniref:LeuD/DmdB family oxidoreductase small subunit n=1 Tax=Herbiconiux sp. TaxID=1871186 RepID=UPI00120A258A|nr:hypothetical protein [Herbiconiux sp.]TAJ46924.1 MAG: 3-isopropylmalate dehydratase [Herbiconiux sp.]